MNSIIAKLHSTGAGLYAEEYRKYDIDRRNAENSKKINYKAKLLPLELVADNPKEKVLPGKNGDEYKLIFSKNYSNDEFNLISTKDNLGVAVYDFVDMNVDETMTETIYYVSDIHIEHQLKLMGMSLVVARKQIREKVKELVSSIKEDRGTILIAGDVADSIELADIFYGELREGLLKAMGGFSMRAIAVLGNHEIWEASRARKNARSNVDEIINEYKKLLPVRLLENELFVIYKGTDEYIIDEETILKSDENELAEVIRDSSLVVLGGVGFSGRNPTFNAKMGLYRTALTFDEDINRSKRFSKVYEKVLKCAMKRQVVVLTHTQMQNWSEKDYNPNWIYINGHTHQNTLIRRKDGTTVLSDNQMGYEPRKWKFNLIRISGYYDPFEQWEDGIYKISAAQYQDFNWGRGISMNEFKREGEIYAIKRESVYMFFLKGRNLCVLDGGRLRKAEFEIEYYYNNLLLYHSTVQKRLGPYRNALKAISKEIKEVGGDGSIHGCIVDVDFLNHIFLNPLDGKIVPYHATSTDKRVVFPNIQNMLRAIDESAGLLDFLRKDFEKKYIKLSNEGKLPALAGTLENAAYTSGGIAEVVYDKRMYQSSRLMSSMQYVFEGNVVRLWRDDLLKPRDTNVPELEGVRII